jgi:hypothetical protein
VASDAGTFMNSDIGSARGAKRAGITRALETET